MAIIQVEIDDEVLADFYVATAATPDPAWTEQERDLWLETMYLQPIVEKTLKDIGDREKLNKVVTEANRKARDKSVAAENRLERKRMDREDALPEKIRPRRDGEPLPAQEEASARPPKARSQ